MCYRSGSRTGGQSGGRSTRRRWRRPRDGRKKSRVSWLMAKTDAATERLMGTPTETETATQPRKDSAGSWNSNMDREREETMRLSSLKKGVAMENGAVHECSRILQRARQSLSLSLSSSLSIIPSFQSLTTTTSCVLLAPQCQSQPKQRCETASIRLSFYSRLSRVTEES